MGSQIMESKRERERDFNNFIGERGLNKMISTILKVTLG
jgi:hypothetical protein